MNSINKFKHEYFDTCEDTLWNLVINALTYLSKKTLHWVERVGYEDRECTKEVYDISIEFDYLDEYKKVLGNKHEMSDVLLEEILKDHLETFMYEEIMQNIKVDFELKNCIGDVEIEFYESKFKGNLFKVDFVLTIYTEY